MSSYALLSRSKGECSCACLLRQLTVKGEGVTQSHYISWVAKLADPRLRKRNSMEKQYRDFELQINRQLMQQLLIELPFRSRSGKSVRTPQMCQLESYLFEQIRARNFNVAFSAFVDTFEFVLDEIGYQLSPGKNSTDISDIDVHVLGNSNENFRNLETVIILIRIIELAVPLQLLVLSNRTVDWKNVGEKRNTNYNIFSVLREFIRKGEKVPELDDCIAVKFYRLISRLLPPYMIRALGKVTNEIKSPRSNWLDSLMLTIWAICQQIMGVVMFTNARCFEGVQDEIFSRLLNDPESIYSFNSSRGRPEVLSMIVTSPENVPEHFINAAKYMKLASPKQRPGLAIIYTRSIQVFCLLGLCSRSEYLPQLQDAARKTQQCVRTFATPALISADVSIHVYLSQLYIISQLEADGTPSKHRFGWKQRYWHFYLELLTTTWPAELTSALSYFSQMLYFIYLANFTGAPYASETAVLVREAYPRIREALFRSAENFPLTRQTIRQLLYCNVAFSYFCTDRYMKDHSTESPLSAWKIYALLSAMVHRLHIGDPLHWEQFKNWQSQYVDIVCAAAQGAATPGPQQASYNHSLYVGMMVIKFSPKSVAYLSSNSIMKLTTTMIASLGKFDPHVREYVIGTFIYIVRHAFYFAPGVLGSLVSLICELLDDQTPMILDPKDYTSLQWNIEFVHDLLELRIFAIRKILAEGDVKAVEYFFDPERECRIRASSLLAICSSNKEIEAVAQKCIKLISDELALVSDAHIPSVLCSHMDDNSLNSAVFSTIVKTRRNAISRSSHFKAITQELPATVEEAPPKTVLLFGETICKYWCEIVGTSLIEEVPPETRRMLVNFMLLWSAFFPGLCSNSSNPANFELGKRALNLIVESFFSKNQLSRDCAFDVFKVIPVPTSGHAVRFVRIVASPSVLKRLADKLDQESSGGDPVLLRGIAKMCAKLIDIVQVLEPSFEEPLGVDLAALLQTLFGHGERFVFDPNPETLFGDRVFGLLKVVSEAEHLLNQSKWDSLRGVLDMIIDFLKSERPKSRKLLQNIMDAMPAFLNNFTFHIPSEKSALMVDDRYARYQSLIISMGEQTKELPNDDFKRDVDKKITESLVNVSIANPDFAFVFSQESVVLNWLALRRAIYEVHSALFDIGNQVVDLPGSARFDDLIQLILRNRGLMAAMCGICHPSEVKALVASLVALFNEFDQGPELAKWAGARILEQTRCPDELFRKNSVECQILIQYLLTMIKPQFSGLLGSFVRLVYMNPSDYMDLDEEISQGNFDHAGLRSLQEWLDGSCSEVKALPSEMLKAMQWICNAVEQKFPGSVEIAMRNLLLLRVLCPLIIMPNMFGVTKHPPSHRPHEALIKIAKFLQKADLNPNTSSYPAISESLRNLLESSCGLRDFSDAPERRVTRSRGEELDMVCRNLHAFLRRHVQEILGYMYSHATGSKVHFSYEYANGTIDLEVTPPTSCASSEISTCQHTIGDKLTRMLQKLGRPCLGISERDKRRPSAMDRSSDEGTIPHKIETNTCWKASYKGVPCTVFSSPDIRACSSPTTVEYVNSVWQSTLEECTDPYIFCDCTWISLSFHQWFDVSLKYYEPVSISMRQHARIPEYLNVPYSFFIGSERLPIDSSLRPLANFNIYLTFDDIENVDLLSLGLPDETVNAARDYERAVRYTNVRLFSEGIARYFTVLVGQTFVFILSEYHTCDVFSLDQLKFMNGSTYFRNIRGTFNMKFKLAMDDNKDLQVKLWEVVTVSRFNSSARPYKPLLELSMTKTSSYLLIMSLVDLCSECGIMRTSAHKLLMSLIRYFDLDSADLDCSLQLSELQVDKVIAISRTLAREHPERAGNVFSSYISILSRKNTGFDHITELVVPWIPHILESNEMDFEVHVRSLLGLIESFEERNEHTAVRSIKTLLWPSFIHKDRYAKTVVDAWVSFALFGCENEAAKVIFPVALGTPMINHLFAQLAEIWSYELQERGLHWYDHPGWKNTNIILHLISQNIWESSSQVIEVLPTLCIIWVTFAGIGDMKLRVAMHSLVNKVAAILLTTKHLSSEAISQLRAAQEKINSDRGLLIFGVSSSLEELTFKDNTYYNNVVEICELVIEITSSVLSNSKMNELCAHVFKHCLRCLSTFNMQFQRRCLLGTVLFRNSVIPDKLIAHLAEIQRVNAGFCVDASVFCVQISSFGLIADKLMIWMEEESIYPYRMLWFAFALCSLRFGPARESSIQVLYYCLRNIQVRGKHDPARIIETLFHTLRPETRDWWESNQAQLTAFPSNDKYFLSRISELLIPALCSSSTRTLAIRACEEFIKLLHEDVVLDGVLIELTFMFYVFEDSSASSTYYSLFSNVDIMNEDDCGAVIEAKLAQDLCIDHESGLLAVVNVCQVLASSFSTIAAARFMRTATSIIDFRLWRNIRPLLYPVLNQYIALSEGDALQESITWASTLGRSQDCGDQLGSALQDVENTLTKAGRHEVIDSKFHVRPPKLVEDWSDEFKELAKGLCGAMAP